MTSTIIGLDLTMMAVHCADAEEYSWSARTSQYVATWDPKEERWVCPLGSEFDRWGCPVATAALVGTRLTPARA